MPKPPRLDLRRLERELAAKAGARGAKLAPGGRPATGLMDLVRENLDALLALQAGGSTWGEIAEGLSAQGYTKADGSRLTGTALTGVISSVRRQAVRRAARSARRQARADLLAQRIDTGAQRRLTLSADLAPSTPSAAASASAAAQDEEVIRREHLHRLQDILKKD